MDDSTASPPPHASHPHRKTLSHDHLDFCHGLLAQIEQPSEKHLQREALQRASNH
jgi:hypothetical protein